MHPFQIQQIADDRRRDRLRSADRAQLLRNDPRSRWPRLTIRRRPPRGAGETTRTPVAIGGSVHCATC